MRLDIETGRFYLGRDYSEALENSSAVPVHIALIPKIEYLREILESLDGLLLPGSNSDVDPLIYGEEPLPRVGQIIPEKDETDLMLLAAAEKLKLPVLGICFGLQTLNVSRGGSLIQDIESQVDNCLKHEQGKPPKRNSHSITVKENSLLARLITKNRKGREGNDVRVNSSHHQAVKNIGKNLIATAWAKDGVVECIEDVTEDRFVFAVQWHPELSWQFDDLSKNIFQTFVDECAKFSQKNKSESRRI